MLGLRVQGKYNASDATQKSAKNSLDLYIWPSTLAGNLDVNPGSSSAGKLSDGS